MKAALKIAFAGVAIVAASPLRADVSDFNVGLDASSILKSLPDAVGQFYPSFVAIGFVILLMGLVANLVTAQSNEASLMAVARACILATAIAVTPFLAQQITTASTEMATKLGSNGLSTAIKIITTVKGGEDFFGHTQAASNATSQAVQDAKDAGFWKSAIIYAKGAWTAQEEQMMATYQLIKAGPDAAVRVVLALIFLCAMMLCWILQALMGLVQYFLLNAALVLMPVFIAGLNTRFFRTQGANYIAQWIGIALWPIGWSLWNIGTLALCDFIADFVATITTQSVPVYTAAGAMIEGVTAMGGLLGAGQLTLLLLMALGVMLFFWVLAGAIGGPFAMQKLVTSGASFFTAQVSSGGGAGMAGMGAGFKLGSSMMAPGFKSAAVAGAGSAMQSMASMNFDNGIDIGRAISAGLPTNVSDIADSKSHPQYSKSETARLAATKMAVMEVGKSAKEFV